MFSVTDWDVNKELIQYSEKYVNEEEYKEK